MDVTHASRSGLALALGAMLALLPYGPARAASVSLIRDAEIEATLAADRRADPGGRGPRARSVRIYIVNDNQLNAFVAGGMNLFLNTGLIMRTEHAGQLAGVIAHEVGHISGGHLSRVGGGATPRGGRDDPCHRARRRRRGRRRPGARHGDHHRRPDLRAEQA